MALSIGFQDLVSFLLTIQATGLWLLRWRDYPHECASFPLDTPSCRLSGKAMARTGLRMMPTFPSPPLKFRTAGFPQYGFKAGLSDGAFPARRPIVAPIWLASLLRAPRFQTCISPLGVGAVVRLSTAI